MFYQQLINKVKQLATKLTWSELKLEMENLRWKISFVTTYYQSIKFMLNPSDWFGLALLQDINSKYRRETFDQRKRRNAVYLWEIGRSRFQLLAIYVSRGGGRGLIHFHWAFLPGIKPVFKQLPLIAIPRACSQASLKKYGSHGRPVVTSSLFREL